MGKVRKFVVKDMLKGTIKDGCCMRFDVIVNYIGIEAYYGKNTWDLYKKYEETRRRKFNKSRDEFINLIKSFEENGCLSKRYPLKIATKSRTEKCLHVRNGAHRFSCALYFGIEDLYCYVKNPTPVTNVGIELFKRRGFTDAEIKILEDKQSEIFKKVGVENE